MPETPTEARLVTDPAELESLCERIAKQRRVALDTEAASFHRFVDRVYLLQLSTDGETALVDPLEIEDLGPVGKLLADPGIEIVLHDADYDLRILDRDYGFRAKKLFDTRLAAELAGEPSLGLGSLLQKHFGVSVDKRFQRADWSRRPLTKGMISYAANDTRYLPELRDKLEARLRELDRLAWAKEEFRRLEELRWTQADPDSEDAYLRVKGAKGLRRRQLAILRELYAWRESTARQLDRARFRVLSNSVLLAIARAAPASTRKLARVSGMSPTIARRHGAEIVEAVDRGKAIPESDLPSVRRTKRPAPDPAYDQRLERLKRLRNEKAKKSELEPGLLCPNNTLQAVARAVPQSKAALDRVTDLRRWQRSVIGDRALLDAVSGK
jgi:ribonuclease D